MIVSERSPGCRERSRRSSGVAPLRNAGLRLPPWVGMRPVGIEAPVHGAILAEASTVALADGSGIVTTLTAARAPRRFHRRSTGEDGGQRRGCSGGVGAVLSALVLSSLPLPRVALRVSLLPALHGAALVVQAKSLSVEPPLDHPTHRRAVAPAVGVAPALARTRIVELSKDGVHVRNAIEGPRTLRSPLGRLMSVVRGVGSRGTLPV
jgi:hypothetical protein